MALKEQHKARKRLAPALAAAPMDSGGWQALRTLYGNVSVGTVEAVRIADMVNTVLASSSTVDPVTRARALGDLLAAYGVGTIVAGVIA